MINMPDIGEFEKRIERLESTIRNNYSIVDKRLASLESRKPAVAKTPPAEEEPVIVEGKDRLQNLEDMRERLQELEDLLLLIELENTKLREGISGNGELHPAVTPDIAERLGRIEEQLSFSRQEGNVEERLHALERKMEQSGALEKRINEIHEAARRKPDHEQVAEKMGELKREHESELARLHERIERIEKAPKVVTRVEKTQPHKDEKSILEEVQMILKSK